MLSAGLNPRRPPPPEPLILIFPVLSVYMTIQSSLLLLSTKTSQNSSNTKVKKEEGSLQCVSGLLSVPAGFAGAAVRETPH